MREEITENKETKQKKPKKRGIITGAIALLVVTVGAVFIGLNFKSIEAGLRRHMMSPDEYYKYVELQTIKDGAEPFFARYEQLREGLHELPKAQTDYEVQLKLGEELQRFFRRLNIEDFSGLDSIGIAFSTSMTNQAMTQSLLAKLLINGETVVSGDLLFDYDKDMMFFGIPELSDTYLFGSLEDAIGDSDAESTKELLQILPEIYKQLPDRKVAEKFLERYSELLLTEIEGVKERSGSLEIEGITQKCTELSYSLDARQIRDTAVLVLEELVKDKEFEEYYIGVVSELEEVETFFLDAEENYDSFVEVLEDKIAEIESLDDDDEFEHIKVNIWVDDNGKVIARKCKMKGEFQLFYGVTKDKDSFGFKADFSTDEPIIKIEGTGKTKDNEASGSFTLDLIDERVAVADFKNVSLDNFYKGNYHGKVIFTPDGEMSDYIEEWNDEGYFKLKEPKLIFSAEATNEESLFEITLKSDGELFAGISWKSKKGNAQAPVYPPEENRMTAETEDEMLRWMATLDAAAFEDTLLAQKVPTIWAEGLADTVRNVQYERASWLFADKEYETARLLFQALGDYNSSDAFEITCRAMVLYEDEKYDEALALLESTEPPNYYAEFCKRDCYLKKAEKLFAEEKYAEALEYYKLYTGGEAQHLPQNGKECYYRLGLEAYETENYAEAYELFSQIQGYKNAASYMSWSDYEGALTQVPFGRLYAPDYEAFTGVVTLPENYLEIPLPTVKENYYQSYMCEYAYTQMCYYVGNENAWEEMQLDPDLGVHFSDAQAEEMSRGIYPTEASYQAFMRNKCEEYYYIPKLKEYLLTNSSVAQLDEESIRRNVVKARTEMELIASLMDKSTSFYISLFGFETMDEFLADAEQKAREDQMFYHILYGIAKREGLSLSEEEFNAYAEEFACSHKITLEEFLKVNDRAVLEQVFLIESAMDYLIDNASFIEEQQK